VSQVPTASPPAELRTWSENLLDRRRAEKSRCALWRKRAGERLDERRSFAVCSRSDVIVTQTVGDSSKRGARLPSGGRADQLVGNGDSRPKFVECIEAPASSCAPQPLQNRALGGFSTPHVAHVRVICSRSASVAIALVSRPFHWQVPRRRVPGEAGTQVSRRPFTCRWCRTGVRRGDARSPSA
jgi:hypothetical protein